MENQTANQSIQAFEKRFGKPHLYLAYHAAFPLELIPDLTYCIWHRFQCDINGQILGIPWTAVSDLLLFLCDEVGHELYKMPIAVRNKLLKKLELNNNFGKKRTNELSDFLRIYVQNNLHNNDTVVKDFAEAQRLTALAYVEPGTATIEIAKAFQTAFMQDETELFRIASITRTLKEPLTETSESRPLLTYAESIAKLAHDDIEGAANQLREFIGQDNRVRVAGIRLDIPFDILDFINQSPGNKPPFDNSLPRDTPGDKNVNSQPKEEGGHFSTLITRITDGEMLKNTLRDLGFNVAIEADVRGSKGQRVRADIVAVLEGECDIGWSRNSEGGYDLTADLWGVAKKHNQTELINAIYQKYAVNKALADQHWRFRLKIKCPRCGSTNTVKYGYQHGKQNYKCCNEICGTQFI